MMRARRLGSCDRRRDVLHIGLHPRGFQEDAFSFDDSIT